jgi:exocyst complex component 2
MDSINVVSPLTPSPIDTER